MTDHSLMKLGKLAPKVDAKRLKLSRYLPAILPTPPDSQDWIGAITGWGMMLNDRLGDCVFAGLGHAVQTWTANMGAMVTITDADILKLYEDWAGYNPMNPNTDQGYVEVDALNNFRKLGFAGHQLLGYADPDPGNFDHVKLSILLFGGIYLGISMPIGWQNADTWDANAGALGSWGGHAVWAPSYNKEGVIGITWGAPKLISWRGLAQYCDESHCLLSPDFISAKGTAGSGFNVAALQNDLSALAA